MCVLCGNKLHDDSCLMVLAVVFEDAVLPSRRDHCQLAGRKEFYDFYWLHFHYCPFSLTLDFRGCPFFGIFTSIQSILLFPPFMKTYDKMLVACNSVIFT